MTCAEFIEIWKHYDKDKSGYLEEKEIGHFLLDLLRVNRVSNLINKYRIMADFVIVLCYLKEFPRSELKK